MDYREVHNIIKNISSNFKCPQCKKNIAVSNIKLMNIFPKDCVFSVYCGKCKANMVLGAHIEQAPTEKERFFNVSTNLKGRKSFSKISGEEVKKTKKFLDNFKGGFGEMFRSG